MSPATRTLRPVQAVAASEERTLAIAEGFALYVSSTRTIP
jgi:hypothetical protein